MFAFAKVSLPKFQSETCMLESPAKIAFLNQKLDSNYN